MPLIFLERECLLNAGLKHPRPDIIFKQSRLHNNVTLGMLCWCSVQRDFKLKQLWSHRMAKHRFLQILRTDTLIITNEKLAYYNLKFRSRVLSNERELPCTKPGSSSSMQGGYTAWLFYYLAWDSMETTECFILRTRLQ